MNIRNALDRIVTVQEGLAITDPVTLSMSRVYKLPPPKNSALPDTPAMINTVELDPTVFASSLLRRKYVVRMQLFAKSADEDWAADIALAFEEELIRAFAKDVTLEGRITNIVQIEGELGLLEWAGKAYPGLDYRMQIDMSEAQTYAV